MQLVKSGKAGGWVDWGVLTVNSSEGLWLHCVILSHLSILKQMRTSKTVG